MELGHGSTLSLFLQSWAYRRLFVPSPAGHNSQWPFVKLDLLLLPHSTGEEMQAGPVRGIPFNSTEVFRNFAVTWIELRVHGASQGLPLLASRSCISSSSEDLEEKAWSVLPIKLGNIHLKLICQSLQRKGTAQRAVKAEVRQLWLHRVTRVNFWNDLQPALGVTCTLSLQLVVPSASAYSPSSRLSCEKQLSF